MIILIRALCYSFLFRSIDLNRHHVICNYPLDVLNEPVYHQFTEPLHTIGNETDALAKQNEIEMKNNAIYESKQLNVAVLNISLSESDLDEKFVKGSGKGGQKINKTRNRVQLVHIPTGIQVSCQDARDLYTNRKIARKMLIEKLDQFYNGAQSKIEQQMDKIRKKKKNASRKSKKKYGVVTTPCNEV